MDTGAKTQWNEVIDRRSREMAEGRVDNRTEKEVMRDIQTKLNAARPQPKPFNDSSVARSKSLSQ